MIASTTAQKHIQPETHFGTDHLKVVNLLNPSSLGTGVNGTGLTSYDALQIKMQALGMSAKIIRRSMIRARDEARWQARKAKAAVIVSPEVQRLEDIRKLKVRYELRHHNLAAAFFNKTPYSAVEQICYTNPDWDELEDTIFEFSNDPPQIVRQRITEWLSEAQSSIRTSDGNWRGDPDANPKPNVGHIWSVTFRPGKDYKFTRKERAEQHAKRRRTEAEWIKLKNERDTKAAIEKAAKETQAVADAANKKPPATKSNGHKHTNNNAQPASRSVKITNIFHLGNNRVETQTIER